MGFLKKHIVILMIILVLIIIAIIMLLHLSMNKKGKENYIEIFHKNENIFEEISSSLMPLGYEVSVLQELGKTVVKQNGNAIEISKSSLDEKTKSNIERAINDLGIQSINKTDAYLEFIYTSNKDLHSIVFATDKNQLITFTNVEHLEGSWYYCYIFHE